MKKRWLPVVGFEGLYEVSNWGRVRSLDRTITVTHNHYPDRSSQRHYKGCLLKSNFDKTKGRFGVALGKGRGSKPKAFSVSVLVLTAFVGPPPAGMECCHAGDDTTSDALHNLRWGTRSENVREAVINGRREAVVKANRDPVKCARHAKIMAKIMREKWADPEYRKRRQAKLYKKRRQAKLES